MLIYLSFIILTFRTTVKSQYTLDGSSYNTISIGDDTREFILYVPEIYREQAQVVSKRVPLVFAIHGSGGNGMSFSSWSGFKQFSDNEKLLGDSFVSIYPSAINGLWSTNTETDVEFFHRMLDIFVGQQIVPGITVDNSKVFFCGYSLGAYFSYFFIQNSPRQISAIVPVAGHAATWSQVETLTKNNIVHIHGDIDAVVAMQPGMNNSVEYWLEKNGCFPSTIENEHQIIERDCGNEYVRTKYVSNCITSNKRIWSIVIRGCGHNWGEMNNILVACERTGFCSSSEVFIELIWNQMNEIILDDFSHFMQTVGIYFLVPMVVLFVILIFCMMIILVLIISFCNVIMKVKQSLKK